MANYNRFGAVYTEPVALYPEAVVADFTDQTSIEVQMDIVEDDIYKNLNPWIRESLWHCNGALVLFYATADQTVIDITNEGGLDYRCTSNWEIIANYSLTPEPPSRGEGLTHGDGMTVSDNSNAIRCTLTAANALSLGDRAFFSCTIDPTSANFSVDSLKKLLNIGTAALIGPQIYTPDESPLIDMYRKKYKEGLDKMSKIANGLENTPELKRRKQVIYDGFHANMLTGDISR